MVAAGTGTFYGQAMTAGSIYTIAGGGPGGLGDGGPGTEAGLPIPQDLAVQGDGSLIIADLRRRQGADDRGLADGGAGQRSWPAPAYVSPGATAGAAW